MNLADIRQYAQKTANIISTIAGMQVIICNSDLLLVADSAIKKFSNEPEVLSELSFLASTMKQRKLVVETNCHSSEGCIHCPKKEQCDINSIICLPIIDGKNVLGGIGIYAHNKEDVQRLIEKNKDFVEFLYRISELLIMKANEEEQTQNLKKKVRQLQNDGYYMSFDDIIGSSKEICELKEQARRFAAGNSTILLQGESGTGKELFARAIHFVSPHNKGAFVAINCAAIPENLIESELFGYEEGAFTGALKGGKIGKFELADGGTLFLDEIGEVPLHLQAKLLRTLQDKKIQRLGGNKEISVDVRIIAATNRNLEHSVANGEFREDLFYRLNVIPLQIPALRERRMDIVDLSQYFLRMYSKALHKDIFDFDKKTMDIMLDYDWPGNIRELQNAVEYAVNISQGPYITQNDLPKKLMQETEFANKKLQLKPLKYIEDEYIREALRIYGTTTEGKEKAARILGLSLATLYRRVKNMNI